MYIIEDSIMKPTKAVKKKKKKVGERGKASIMEGMNLFNLHCTYIWNYHNETPLALLMYTNSKHNKTI
jgi:hypothetical protein